MAQNPADDEIELVPESRAPDKTGEFHQVLQGQTAVARVGDKVHGGLVTSCAMVLAYGADDSVGVYHWPFTQLSNPEYMNEFRGLCKLVRPVKIYIVTNNFLGQKKIRDIYIKEARHLQQAVGDVPTSYYVIDDTRDQTPFLQLKKDTPEGVGQRLKLIDLNVDLDTSEYLV